MRQALLLSVLLGASLLGVVLTQDIVGNSGDSVLHFLYAREAVNHPHLLLDHWAKPFFTLLAMPFAQAGFEGMMAMNVLLAAATLFFAHRFAASKGWSQPWLLLIFLLSAPLYLRLIFSGLTEYLFGFLLILALWWTEKKRWIASAVVISLLPFVRSEGLIIIGVWACWLGINGKWKTLPWLLAGNVAYALIGFPHYSTLLWVFTEVPYASLSSPYGEGHFFDFFHRLNYAIEKVNYVLMLVGLLAIGLTMWRRGMLRGLKANTTLIWSSFLAYFLAHAVFWHAGIFNSMGLPRVLVAVVPMVALMELKGIHALQSRWTPARWQRPAAMVMALVCIGFLFTPRPQGVAIGPGMFAVPEHQLIDDAVVPYLNQAPWFRPENTVAYSHPYLAIALKHDYFDPTQHVLSSPAHLEELPSGSVAVIDSWFSVVEGDVQPDSLPALGFALKQRISSEASPHAFEIWIKE